MEDEQVFAIDRFLEATEGEGNKKIDAACKNALQAVYQQRKKKKENTMKKSAKPASRRGRPTIYTREVIARVMKLVKPGIRTVKEAVEVVAKQSHKSFKYVPFLVASGKLGMNLRHGAKKLAKVISK